MERFDLVVVGAGPGGYPAAIRGAQLGLKTAIVEREAWGGTCLNWGCIPTKALIASAERYRQVTESATLGIEVDPPFPDYPAMVRRKRAIVKQLAGGVEGLLYSNGVKMVRGEASFLDASTLSVHSPDGDLIRLVSTHFIVATGSLPRPLPGLPSSPRILDSRSFLELQELPDRLLVLGGGVIGCELASLAARLECRVSLVEMGDRLLGNIDEDLGTEVRRGLEDLGVRVMTGERVDQVAEDQDGVSLLVGGESLRGDTLLVAAGRQPATRPVRLERAGVLLDSEGAVPVDSRGRSSVPSIYAVGDVIAGSSLLAHVATGQGVAAAERIAGLAPEPSRLPPPAVICTSPEVACAGLSEEEARRRGHALLIGRFPLSASGRALTSGQGRGFVKWLADRESGVILGASAVSDSASELIGEATLALRMGMTLGQMATTLHPHPTLSEAWGEAAAAALGRAINLPPVHPFR